MSTQTLTADRFDPFKIYDPATLVASDPIEIDAPAMVVWKVFATVFPSAV